MEQITEPEMLRRAAAYCSTAERCIQDVQKKIKAAGLSQEEGERIIARLLQEKFIDEHRFARYFVNDKLRFNKWTHQNRIRTSKKEYPCPHPFGSAGRDRRKRICRYPPIIAEGEKEIDQRQGRTGYLHQTPPFCCRPWL